MRTEDAAAAGITDCNSKVANIPLKSSTPGCANGNARVKQILQYVSL